MDNTNVDFVKKIIHDKTKKNETNSENNIDENLAPHPYADHYKMDHPKRGTAIIFNHVKFSSSKIRKREGSNKDRDELTAVLQELDFDVIAHDDLTEKEILGVLVITSQMDHSDADCLVVVVLTHGDTDKLYARDREYPTKRLWSYFNARNCPTLAGKPKLFFVQACRGQGLHQSHTLHYKTNGVQTDHVSSDVAYYTIPVMADILIMYSTSEGFYSWRDPKKGSWFIQSLVKQLRLHCKTKDLLTILTFVNREVAVDFTSHQPSIPLLSGRKQICSIVSMLTRQLYFTKRDDECQLPHKISECSA